MEQLKEAYFKMKERILLAGYNTVEKPERTACIRHTNQLQVECTDEEVGQDASVGDDEIGHKVREDEGEHDDPVGAEDDADSLPVLLPLAEDKVLGLVVLPSELVADLYATHFEFWEKIIWVLFLGDGPRLGD